MHATLISYFFIIASLIIVHGQEWRDELDEIRREQGILKNIVEQLQIENRQLHSRLINVEKNNEDLLEKVRELSHKEHQHEDGSKSLQSDTIKEYSLQRNHSHLTKDKRNNRVTRIVPVIPIAFSAYISQKFNNNIGSQHTFVYDTIRSNNGNAYNQQNGVFTAPRDGIFAFLWTISAEGAKGTDGYFGEVNTELVVNSDVRGRSHADTEAMYDDDEATGFAILHLNEGDHVFIRSGLVQGQLQSHYHMEWTFSGWQIA